MILGIPLYDVAHCRAGDKGDDSILALVPYRPTDFATLRTLVTEDVISRHFSAYEPGQILIVNLPTLSAMVISVRDRLSGGVTRSTGSDPHGKTLSSHLLSLRLNWPYDRLSHLAVG